MILAEVSFPSKQRVLRLRIQIIKEPSSVLLGKHPREPPWLVLERLHVLNLHDQDIAGLSGLDVERARQIVDFGQVDVSDVVCRVVVADLAAGPVEAFDFDDLAVGDGADARN